MHISVSNIREGCTKRRRGKYIYKDSFFGFLAIWLQWDFVKCSEHHDLRKHRAPFDLTLLDSFNYNIVCSYRFWYELKWVLYLDIGVKVVLRFLLSWAKWGADWFLGEKKFFKLARKVNKMTYIKFLKKWHQWRYFVQILNIWIFRLGKIRNSSTYSNDMIWCVNMKMALERPRNVSAFQHVLLHIFA